MFEGKGGKMEVQTKSKIKLKVGQVEVEFEGSESYLKEQLPSLVELLCSYAPEETHDFEVEEEDILPESKDPAKKKFELTTNTIAAKLNVNSGPELVLAACAHLSLVKGADTFHRKNILAEMKLASNYYKKTHGKNLSQSLKALIRDGKIIESTQDVYALNASTKKTLETRLSGN